MQVSGTVLDTPFQTEKRIPAANVDYRTPRENRGEKEQRLEEYLSRSQHTLLRGSAFITDAALLDQKPAPRSQCRLQKREKEQHSWKSTSAGLEKVELRGSVSIIDAALLSTTGHHIRDDFHV